MAQQAKDADDLLFFPNHWAAKLEPYLAPRAQANTNNHHSTLQQEQQQQQQQQPFLTLTYAQSLDSHLSLAPGVRTTLSGAETKAMTHFLRSRHDAILVGAGTAVADDPGLNCRVGCVVSGGGGGDEDDDDNDSPSSSACQHGKEGQGVEIGQGGETEGDAIATRKRAHRPAPSPQPVILDPHARWHIRETNKVIKLAREGKGLPPWIVVARQCVERVDGESRRVVEQAGGRYLVVEGSLRTPTTTTAEVAEEEEEEDGPGVAKKDATTSQRFQLSWSDILSTLAAEGVRSLMVEGGGRVIDELLALGQAHARSDVDNERGSVRIDSVIVTIAPVWLGAGGVQVAPARPDAQTAGPRLKEVSWMQMGEDMVLAGRIAR